jgi:hypothetical protein
MYESDKVLEGARRLLEHAETIRKTVDLSGASLAIDDCYEVWGSGFISIPYDFTLQVRDGCGRYWEERRGGGHALRGLEQLTLQVRDGGGKIMGGWVVAGDFTPHGPEQFKLHNHRSCIAHM